MGEARRIAEGSRARRMAEGRRKKEQRGGRWNRQAYECRVKTEEETREDVGWDAYVGHVV